VNSVVVLMTSSKLAAIKFLGKKSKIHKKKFLEENRSEKK